MKKIRLGVNIDHVATVRNARGEVYPSPLRAANLAEKSGADSVTIHLREDRRHINDKDLKLIKKNINIPLNLEIAATNEMVNIALKRRPPLPFNKISLGPVGQLDEIIGFPKVKASSKTFGKPSYFEDKINASDNFI